MLLPRASCFARRSVVGRRWPLLSSLLGHDHRISLPLLAQVRHAAGDLPRRPSSLNKKCGLRGRTFAVNADAQAPRRNGGAVSAGGGKATAAVRQPSTEKGESSAVLRSDSSSIAAAAEVLGAQQRHSSTRSNRSSKRRGSPSGEPASLPAEPQAPAQKPTQQQRSPSSRRPPPPPEGQRRQNISEAEVQVEAVLDGGKDADATPPAAATGGSQPEAATASPVGLPLSTAERMRRRVLRARASLQSSQAAEDGADRANTTAMKSDRTKDPIIDAKPGDNRARGRGRSRGNVKKASRGGKAPAPAPPAALLHDNPILYPDYRERVLTIFQQFADINLALGERYKTQSYVSAIERLKRDDTILKILPPNLIPLPEGASARILESMDAGTLQDYLTRRKFVLSPANPLPGVGDKLRKKVVEILQTGDVEELHKMNAMPIIRAIRELTQVHGVGPRTAISFYKQFGITTVEELRQHAAAQDSAKSTNSGSAGAKKAAGKNALRLTDAQRIGLAYHTDIAQRIPHAEGRVHEALMRLRLRKHLGDAYELTVCGSYRRGVATSGDIDVLVTRKHGGGSGSPPTEVNVLSTFVEMLKKDGYIEAALAQGSTKFMGLCRLRPSQKGSTDPPRRRSPARRLDIRYVDTASYPAALLYFTGSKNFNVMMRSKAISKGFVLNEYGLFRNPSKDARGTHNLHEMIGKLARTHYYASKSLLLTTEDQDEAGGKAKSSAAVRQADDMFQKVEALRVRVTCEKDVFDAIGMEYVSPEQRNV